MKTVDQLKVGDTVWFDDVNNRHNRPPQECKVSKMGNKIILVVYGIASSKRFRKDTLRSDDNYGHQWLILDLQDEADKKERKRLLTKLGNNWMRVKDDVSLEDVRQALKLLRIDAE